MPTDITCRRCGQTLRVADDPRPQGLTCPRCLADIPDSSGVQATAPTPRDDRPRLPDVDVRRDWRATFVLLIGLIVLGVLGFLGTAYARTDRGEFASGILILLVIQAILILIVRALLRANSALGAHTGWTVVRALVISIIVLLLVVLALLIFLFAVCVVNPPRLGP